MARLPRMTRPSRGEPLIACLDAGTTGCRVVLFTASGRVLTTAYREYGSIFLSPTWIEHDPATWISAAGDTLRRAVRDAGPAAKSVVALAVTTQRATLIPVDSDGRPLANAILWQDRRAAPQAASIAESIGGQRIYRKTGLRVDSYFSLPKLLWLRENRPELFDKTSRFLTVHDFLVHHLCGEFVTDWTQASRTMLLDIEKLRWDDELLEYAGLSERRLPRLTAPGSIAGPIRKALAAELGLPAGIPVVAMGGDQQAAALGMGAIHRGEVGVNTGTGSFVLAPTEVPTRDSAMRMLCTASAVPGQWLLEAAVFTTGSIYRWFRDQFGRVEMQRGEQMGISAYRLMDEQASSAPPGSNGILMLPHFTAAGAPRWDPEARGVFFGLSLGHDRADVIRSILEGIALETAGNIRVVEELLGALTVVKAGGGLCRSVLFNQIQADACGKRVEPRSSGQSSAVGAAVGAAVAVGLFPDHEAAVRCFLAADDEPAVEPGEENRLLYRRLLVLQNELHAALSRGELYRMAQGLKNGDSAV